MEDQNSRPNNNNTQSSQENLPQKVNINFKKCKWYSKNSTKKSPKEEKLKTPEKKPARARGRKAKQKQSIIDLSDESPRPKKRRVGTTNIFKSKKYLSPSAQLDTKIPKVSDLLKAKEEQKKLKEIDELIQKSSTQFLKELTYNTAEPEKEEKVKLKERNCKNITVLQLERRFNTDVGFLDGIFNGIIYSERHELFKKQKSRDSSSLKEDLRVSESLGVFTSEQLVFLVSLFRDRYDNGNKYKNSDYYFKVLLPEYCTKIFMEYHKMSQEMALEYLKNVPVPDLFGIM